MGAGSPGETERNAGGGATTGTDRHSIWWVYLLECRGGRIYTGIAKDPEARFRRHLAGKGAAFTRINPPRTLLGMRRCASRGEALRLEHALRRKSRKEKIAWASGAGTT